MSVFLCKLSFKMLYEWKKEILLVMIGIIICSCAVIKFTDSFTNFENVYYDSKGSKEERIFYENRIQFTFNDVENITDIFEQLKNYDGINNVKLKGNYEIVSGKDFPVAVYSNIPNFSKHDTSIGSIPEKIEDGTIVLSFSALHALEGSVSSGTNLGDIVEIVDEVPQKTKYTVFYSCDQQFPIGNKSYDIVAENFYFPENLISQNDFIELEKTEKMSEIELIYIYNDSFSERQKDDVKQIVKSIRPYKSTYNEIMENTIGVSDYLNLMGSIIIGVVIAVLNALFIYQSVLKRRMSSYSVLKILGLKNIWLRIMIIFEMVIVFVLSYIVSVVLFIIYCGVTNELVYNLRYSVGYSFGLLLVIYFLLSLLVTRQMVKSQPIEGYLINRRG